MEDLPIEIAADIVSRLKTKEAAVTCSLVSSRWTNLWTESRNLDLDFRNKKYNKHVNHVLNKLRHHQGDIDTMNIALNDDLSFVEWLEFANLKRVQSLMIDLKIRSKNIDLSNHKQTSQSVLNLDSTWNRLTVLSLRSVAVQNQDLDLLLSMSPNLETVLLENVPVTRLTLSHAKLKRLELLNCVQTLDVESAPNLEYLKHVPVKKYKSTIREVDEDGLKLGTVYLGGPLCRHTLGVFAEKAAALQNLILEMDVYCEHEDDCWGESERDILFPAFKNLKQLELRFTASQKYEEDYRQMSTALKIINACSSSLEKLTLEYEILRDGHEHEDEDEDADDEDVDDYPFTNDVVNEWLREVHVVGWSGLRSEVRLMRYLIHTCPNIQRLLLDPTPPHQAEICWPATFSPVPKFKRQVDSATQVARKITDYLHMYKD